MNFRLDDDQLALQAAVQRFVGDAMDGGLRRRLFESDSGFSREFWSGLMGLGLGGIAIDETYGGLGLGLVDLALAAEVLGHEAAPGPFLGHVLAAVAIGAAGTELQKRRWLPRLASGEAIGAIAISEPDDRWRPADWRLELLDGAVSGTKTHVLYGDVAQLVVIGLRGGGLAVVDAAQTPFKSEPVDGSDRTRRLWTLSFDEAAAEPLLANPDPGEALFDALSVLLAADAFGGAARCLQMTAEYAKTRVQFGQPIAQFQGVKHRLANLASEIEPCRGLYWYAALAQDLKQVDRSRVASLAKAHLSDVFNRAARTAVELHGGIGFTWAFDLQIWVKRAMFDFAFGATPVRHRSWAMQAEIGAA